MNWRWTAQRLIISTFLVVHLGATTLWVMPDCPLRARTYGLVSYYIMPLGLWQFWTMFAPDPVKFTYTLESQVIDGEGLRYNFAFPRLAGYSFWQALPRFRYSKYAANMAIDAFNEPRLFAARHVARSLGLTADRFPIEVHLYYQIRDSPAPGGPPPDPMAPLRTSPLGTYRFEKFSEVWP